MLKGKNMKKESLVKVFNEMKSIMPDASEKGNAFKMAEFESFLTKMRKNAIAEAKKKKNSIDRDHPMFGSINLLRPMGRGRDELSYTKLLAYFLNPKEKHGFDGKITHAFLKEIFYPEFEYDQISVVSEYYCNDGSRVDIWISGEYHDETVNEQNFLVIIEAKVDASVEEKQLSKYSDQAYKWEKENSSWQVSKVLLIPGNNKSGNVKGWKKLLFFDVADLIWKAIKDEKFKPGFHYAKFYLTSIYQDILGLDFSQGQTINPYSYLTALTPED